LIRTGRGMVLIAGALALLISGVAAARTHTSRHTTEIAVQNVFVGQQGRLSVSGVLHSDSRACRQFNDVGLYRKRAGGDEFMDTGFVSYPHGAWATRTKRGAVVDGARFYLKVSKLTIVSVRNGHHRRRIVCGGDRVPVTLPPPGTPGSATQ